MSLRDYGIDAVARAMTSGAPGDTFAARVMAPLYGRPQPAFRDRVMARLDAPRPRRKVRALHAALAAAAALVLVASWRAETKLPAAPAPLLVDPRIGEQAFATPAAPAVQEARPTPYRARAGGATIAASGRGRAPELRTEPGRPIYSIAALERPGDLSVPALAPAPPAITPLERPSALSVPGLRFERENK